MEAFTASTEEIQLATDILVRSNGEKDGILDSKAAVDLFQRSGLPYTTLRDIWAMADTDGSGDLSKAELTVAVRLMGWVQAGEVLDCSLLGKCGPLPTLEGFTDVPRPSRHTHHHPIPSTYFPPVKREDVRRFHKTFWEEGPTNGLLHADKVIDVFMTYDLPYLTLYEIRKLVDRNERGQLEFCEFAAGLYVIQALQSCQIPSLPSSIPGRIFEQLSDPKLLETPAASPPKPPKPPLPSSRPSSSRTTVPLPSPVANQPSTCQDEKIDPPWDVEPHEKLGYDKQFLTLDPERKEYIEGSTFAKFMLGYMLPPNDLAHIWNLADIENDNKMTRDEFAVAMHLIKQKLAGNEIPMQLPPTLVPPALRPKSSPNRPPIVPRRPSKAKPPQPPPKPDVIRRMSISKGSSPPSATVATTTTRSLPLRPRQSVVLIPGPSISAHSTPSELLSPFEDPVPSTSDYIPGPDSAPASSTTEIPAYTNHNHIPIEPIEEFKKESARLTNQVESLLSQLKAQQEYREANEVLKGENERLKSQVRDMERTVSEVLSANERHGSQEQHMQEITRLTAELAERDTKIETAERMLAVVTGEGIELRGEIRDLQNSLNKAKVERDGLKEVVTNQNGQISELRARVAEMGKALSEPASTTNNRELRVLFRDVTKENEHLKIQVRDMERSMEQLLLSSRSHAKQDELERENRRLKQHVQELEFIATRLDDSVHNSSRNRDSENAAALKENEELRKKLREGKRIFSDYRSTTETKIEEMRQQITDLSRDNARLLELNSSTSNQQITEENVPPPAYTLIV